MFQSKSHRCDAAAPFSIMPSQQLLLGLERDWTAAFPLQDVHLLKRVLQLCLLLINTMYMM